MPNETAEDLELYHFGIKGMKWGVRRKEGADGTVGSRVKAKKEAEPESEDSSRAKTLKKKSVSSLSNKELSELNNRMNLEQNYARLTAKPGKLEKGKKLMKGGLGVAATAQQVYSLANSPMVKTLRKAIK